MEVAFSGATHGARTALGHEPNELRAGDPADLVLVDAEDRGPRGRRAPTAQLVVSGGRVVGRDGEYVGPGRTGEQER